MHLQIFQFTNLIRIQKKLKQQRKKVCRVILIGSTLKISASQLCHRLYCSWCLNNLHLLFDGVACMFSTYDVRTTHVRICRATKDLTVLEFCVMY